MEENNHPAFMPSLVSGLMLGVLLVIYSLVLYLFDLNENIWLSSVSYLITGAFLFYAITSFRDNKQNGLLSFGKGVGLGTLIGFFASLILALFIYVYITYVDPGVIEEAMIRAEESVLQSQPDISDADLDNAMEIVEIFTSPGIMASMSIIWYTMVSVVFSLLISIFAKREDINIA